MKQGMEQKYSIAWFKLAEFVARREKERALGLYRLLAHAIHDQAVALQLEGDLWAAFNDPKALQFYDRAAQLYLQSGRLTQAAAVHEHIATIDPTSVKNLQQLLELYQAISLWPAYASAAARYLVALKESGVDGSVCQTACSGSVETLCALASPGALDIFLKSLEALDQDLFERVKELLA